MTSSLSFSQSRSFIINNKLQVTNNIWLSVVSFGSLCPVVQTCTGGKSSLDASFCSPWSIFVCVGLSWGILDPPSGRSLGDLFKHCVKYIKDAFPVCVWSISYQTSSANSIQQPSVSEPRWILTVRAGTMGQHGAIQYVLVLSGLWENDLSDIRAFRSYYGSSRDSLHFSQQNCAIYWPVLLIGMILITFIVIFVWH